MRLIDGRKLKENSNIELRGEPVSLAEEHSTDGLQSTARSSERQPTETAEHSELVGLCSSSLFFMGARMARLYFLSFLDFLSTIGL